MFIFLRGDFLKTKKVKKVISILIIILTLIAIYLIAFNKEKPELKSIKSKEELKKIYNWEYADEEDISLFTKIIAMPFTYYDYTPRYYHRYKYTNGRNYRYDDIDVVYSDSLSIGNVKINPNIDVVAETASSSRTTKDYSKTNIQVENVDEADITKTDGDYIYSLSENNVIITDARDPKSIKIASKISLYDCIPEDLLLCNGKLVVIFRENSFRNYNSNTLVEIYDISDKENPKSVKSFTLYEPYYTCRCIDNNLYVISSGILRMENNEVATYYKENSKIKEIDLKNIYYFTNIKTDTQTLISKVNLENLNEDISLNSYLIDIANSYVSENSIYLLNYTYSNSSFNSKPPISSLFTLKGVFGPDSYEEKYKKDDDDYTEIYKFDIQNDGSIKYKAKGKTKGQTINQYSFDEFNGNLRIALYDGDGSRVVVFDDNMKKIGESDYVARGEKMYSSRFIGNKLYFVTFRTMDPLFVVDLSNPREPEILGELKIPGYSTYLHPYDETHIIGIGMQTEETVNRGYDGRVTSTSSRITGMKMALFDVSDVTNPKEISHTVIGDRRTTSAILDNPKALLFSKEKELIAIPVNNYSEDFSISSSENTETVISSYTNYNKNYISEGYLVYKLNLDGFKLKGTITHDYSKNGNSRYSYGTRLLRGLYIENNLFTISENEIKINNLDDLKELAKLEIIKKEEPKKGIDLLEGVDLNGN